MNERRKEGRQARRPNPGWGLEPPRSSLFPRGRARVKGEGAGQGAGQGAGPPGEEAPRPPAKGPFEKARGVRPGKPCRAVPCHAARPAAGAAQPGPGPSAGRRPGRLGGLGGAPLLAVGGAPRPRSVVPLQGAEPGRGRGGAPVLPPPRAGLPLRAAALPSPPLARARPGGQRAAQRQRPPAVGLAAALRRPAARLLAGLLVGRRLHAFPVRRRAAGRRLPGLPAARRARQRPLPPLLASPAGQRQPRRRPRSLALAAGVRGVHRRAGRHAGHRGRHDRRRGIHLRHAGAHLPAGGLPDREPHAPRRRPRLGQGAQLSRPAPEQHLRGCPPREGGAGAPKWPPRQFLDGSLPWGCLLSMEFLICSSTMGWGV